MTRRETSGTCFFRNRYCHKVKPLQTLRKEACAKIFNEHKQYTTQLSRSIMRNACSLNSCNTNINIYLIQILTFFTCNDIKSRLSKIDMLHTVLHWTKTSGFTYILQISINPRKTMYLNY